MPADRTKPSTPTKTKTKAMDRPSDPSSPSKTGWSMGDKALLFEHVIQHGQNDWDKAVPGKTWKQAREQWK
nr:hypothetical protein I302_03710 [Kwoniella bestiolae CBS 10118]OCF26033.1 hypothetical protein I302_03710 [Kwoniella bestiolae CBS 10118]